jgi:hypothetical protein
MAHVDGALELTLDEDDQMSNSYDNVDFFNPLSVTCGWGCGELLPEFYLDVARCNGAEAFALEDGFKERNEPSPWVQVFQSAKYVAHKQIFARLIYD